MKKFIPDHILRNIVRAFEEENGYFVWDELPGWLRAVDPSVKRLKLREMEDGGYMITIEFVKNGETAFMLRWA
jgi:hypothetical protein